MKNFFKITLATLLFLEVLVNQAIFAHIDTKSLNTNIAHTEQQLPLSTQLKLFLKNGGLKKDYTDLLQTFFGKMLVKRVLNSNQYNYWPSYLEKDHCYRLLGALGHMLTFNDLEQFYAEIKSGCITTEILNYSQIPPLRIWWSNHAAELPHYWIDHLIELFRNPLQAIDPTYESTLGEELVAASLHNHRELLYTYYDHEIKQLIKNGDRSKPEFYIASYELLAQYIGYADTFSTQIGMIIPIFNEALEEMNYYQLENQIHSKGLHAYFLTPRNLQKDLPVIVIFRGTDGTASQYRDLDPSGIGKQVYELNADKIFTIIKEYVNQVNHPIKLILTGHSLGATDAQRSLITATSSDYLDLFEKITCLFFASPKLDFETIANWHEALEKQPPKKTEIDLTFAYNKNDIITWVGNINLTEIAPPFIQCNYFIVSSNSRLSPFKNHSDRFFNKGNFNFDHHCTFKFFQSYLEEDIIKWIKKLENLKNTSQWYLTFKSFFFEMETIEDLENTIEKLKEAQIQFQDFKVENTEQSWLEWTASNAIQYSLKPVYYLFGWFIGDHTSQE